MPIGIHLQSMIFVCSFTMSILTVYFRFLVGSAIIFRIFLINVFTLCTLVFVHHFRSEVPNTKATGPLA